MRFHRLLFPRKRARRASGWCTCAWRRRDLTENTPASGQNCNTPPSQCPSPCYFSIPPDSANHRRQSSKPFMGIWLKLAQLSPNATRARRVFSRGSPACASASCWPLILRSQVSETGSAPLARGRRAKLRNWDNNTW